MQRTIHLLTWNVVRSFFSNLKDKMRNGATKTVPIGKNG